MTKLERDATIAAWDRSVTALRAGNDASANDAGLTARILLALYGRDLTLGCASFVIPAAVAFGR